jgi:hypothetical protein
MQLDPEDDVWKVTADWTVNHFGYACREIHHVWYPIHLWVMHIEPGETTRWVVTHLDGNKLNNRKSNLAKTAAKRLPNDRMRVWTSIERNGRRARICTMTKEKKRARVLIPWNSGLDAPWNALSTLLVQHARDKVDACHNIFHFLYSEFGTQRYQPRFLQDAAYV